MTITDNSGRFKHGQLHCGMCRRCGLPFVAVGFGRVVCPACSKCKQCGGEIEGQKSQKIFCSRKCWHANLMALGGYKRVCITCRKEFRAPATTRLICPSCHLCQECNEPIHNQSQDRFCSPSCVGKWRSKHDARVLEALKKARTIAHGKEIRAKAGQSMRGKARPHTRGDKHPQWRGGVTPLRQIERYRTENAEWRRQVFERDDYACQKCGVRGGTLHAHHIKPWALYQELRYDVGNGQTLCVPCHRIETNIEQAAIRAEMKLRGIPTNQHG